MSVIGNRSSILNCHEEPRHDREVKGHVALVAGPEIRGRILGPLIGFGEEHPVGKSLINVAAQRVAETRGFREGSHSLFPRARKDTARRRDEGHRHPGRARNRAFPERLVNLRVIEVEVRLVW